VSLDNSFGGGFYTGAARSLVLASLLVLGMVGGASAQFPGQEAWSYNYGDTVFGVAVENGEVYAGGTGNSVVKLDSNGNEVWSYSYGDTVFGVAVENGEVYAGGSGNSVVKLDSNGNEVWSYNYGDLVQSVAVENGEVYAGGTGNSVVKLDSNGNEVWSYNYGDTVFGVAVENGEVYAVGSGNSVVKLDSNGNEVWSYDYGARVQSVAVENGEVYAGGYQNSVVKLNSNGNEEWSYNYGDLVRGVAVENGEVYAGGYQNSVVKLDSNGNEVWSYSYGDLVRGVAVENGEVYAGGSGNSVVKLVFNKAPVFDSSSVSPDPVLIGENVSYSASASDSDGSISSLELTVFKDGSQVYSDTVSGSSSYSWSDVFSPSSGGSLDARFTATDDAGAETVEWVNRSLTDSAPSVSLSMDSKQFKYDADYQFSVDASDSYPEEDLQCDVSRNGSLVEEVYLKEGTNSSYSGTASSDLGPHSLSVSCTDNTGNTGSDSASYEVKAYEIESVYGADPVYETENRTFELDLKTGEMVNSADFSLNYDGSVLASKSLSLNGIETLRPNLYHAVPLVDSNQTMKNWNIAFDLNKTDFQSSSTTIISDSSSSQSQTVLHVIENLVVDTDSDRYIEKEDAQVFLDYTDHGFRGSLDCTLGLNGSTKTGGCSQKIDTGLARSNKESVSVSGSTVLSFNGDTRNVSASNINVDVYRKILTDGSSVQGVTGEKGLEFNIYNEENRSQSLNGNLVYNFDVSHHGEHSRNYAFDLNNVSTGELYLYPGWADYSITGPVQYSSNADQNQNNLVYPDRQYNLYNQSLDNRTDMVDLYLLRDSLASPVYFEVLDQSGDGVSAATVTVRRYFIGENGYLTVAKSETDSDGVATTYMRVNEIYYKYTVEKDGKVLLDTNRQILTCQSNPCTKTLRVNPEEDNPYFIQKKGFSYNTSKITDSDGNLTGFQATVSHDSDVMQQANLKVERAAPLGKDTICDLSATSNPTTLVCSFDEPAGDDAVSYSLTASTSDYKYTLDTGYINAAGNIFQDNAYFAAAIIFLMFSMMGMVTPKLGIVFSTAGVLVPWWLGFYSLSIGAAGSLAIVAIVLVVTSNS